MKIQIASTGSYLPELVITNDDLAGIVETNDEWIQTRSGIKSRHYTSGEPTWYMGATAAARAIEGIDPAAIGLIAVTTVTPDYVTPATASIIQAEIGAVNAFCFDLNAGCTGFVYAFDLAAAYLAAMPFEYALVVSTETLTKLTNFEDRKTCVLFGDGAGAMLLRRTPAGEAAEITGRFFGGQGEGAEYLVGESFAVKHPFLPDEKFPARFPDHTAGRDLSMAGREVYKFAVNALPEAVEKAVADAGWTMDQVDLIVPHQANGRIIQGAAKRLGVGPDVMIERIEAIANTSSATIPIVTDQLVREGVLRRGMRVVFCGFGGGLCYGAVAFVY